MKIRLWVATGLWVAVIAGLLLIPGDSLPDLSWFSLDKLGHFGLFLIWAWLWARTLEPLSTPKVSALLVFVCLWALGTEFLQAAFASGRSAEIADVLADVAGFTVGLWGYLRLHLPRRLLGKLLRVSEV